MSSPGQEGQSQAFRKWWAKYRRRLGNAGVCYPAIRDAFEAGVRSAPSNMLPKQERPAFTGPEE